MMSKVVFLLCVVCVCQSAFIEKLTKCKLQEDLNLDEVCCRNIMGQVIKDLSDSGLPEYDIPILDPLHLTNISIPILNVVDLTLLDGTAKGLKGCIVNEHKVNIEKGAAQLDVTCDVRIKGRYKVFSSSEIVKTLFGGDTVRGEGNGKVKIEKLHLKFDYNFVLKKRDGEIYIIVTTDKIKYKYKILGKMVFAADNLYLGDNESSKLIIDVLNQNWKNLFDTFGGSFMDRALEIVHKIIKTFYANVATKYLIVDDLERFVSN